MQSKRRTRGGAWMKFRLLMWKNFLQQWRHPVQTVIELLLPALTVTLILLLRWQVEPSQVDTLSYPPISANTGNYSRMVLYGMNASELAIAYSPTSPVLHEVMKSSLINLILNNLIDNMDTATLENITGIVIPPDFTINNINASIIEALGDGINVLNYENSQELRGLYIQEETTRRVIAAVEFDDLLYGAIELPQNLSYALRFPERPRLNSFFNQGGRSWRTDNIFPIFELPGPRYPWSNEGGTDPGYVTEMFIALQQEISIELVSRVTGQYLKTFKVNIQRYPHPPYINDPATNILRILFPMFIMLSFSYTATNIVRAITVEKELQLKETMKIMGLPTWLHWSAWFCKQFIFQLVTATLIVVLLTFMTGSSRVFPYRVIHILKGVHNAKNVQVHWFTNEDGTKFGVFNNTPCSILFIYILIYLCCMIFFCFMLSGFFSKGSTAALFTAVIWFLTYIPGFLLAMDVEITIGAQAILCLSINTAMANGFQLMLAKESTGGLQWGEFMSSPTTETSRFVFGYVMIMLVVDSVLYMLITLYFEQVLPGPFGAPKPWYFPFTKKFWCPVKKTANKYVDSVEQCDDIIKEKDPANHAVGVKMHNLTKVYGNHIAVNHLSMNIYDDQITVLLGHNGAGKSTTISMLTGNLEITHGTVSIAGYDMSTQAACARSHIGLCPQHNVLFNELTVKEHLEFFARLKGFTGAELQSDIETLIEKLELKEKRDYPSKGLSGGQKRRLCVGIALSGAAKVVLLDEPTSGMDPASRRGLWELLQKEKKGRSLILTTHFMDEADILGDRVAIMAHGKLQCMGSPYFLKRHYGVGYTLVVVKDNEFNSERCTALINNYIPGTVVKEDRGCEITYSLVNEYSHTYENMLNDLENNVSEIKFKNYGLASTTLEEVFMSVGSDLGPANSNATQNDNDDDATTATDSTTDIAYKLEIDSSLEELDKDESSVSGCMLLMQHVWAVWLKLTLMWARSLWLVLIQFIAPILLMNTTLGLVQYVMTLVPTIKKRLLMLSEGYAATETLLSYNGSSTTSLGGLAATAYETMFQSSGIENMALTKVEGQAIDEYYLNRASDTVAMGEMRHSVLIGSTFYEDSATAWFSNFGYHDVAMSLSAVHAALLKATNPEATLHVYNHPLETTYNDQTDSQTMLSMLSIQLATGVGSSVGIVSAVFIMFYIKERVSGAKLLQKAAGVQPVVLWVSAAIFDWLWFLVISITIIIACIVYNVIGLSSAAELGRLYLCIMFYGAAMLPLTYLLSLLFKGPALGFVSYFFMNVLFGIVGSKIVESLSSSQLNTKDMADFIDNILQIYPLYSFVSAIRFLNQIGLQEHTCLQKCEYMLVVHPNVECSMETMCNQSALCCVVENPQFRWEEPGVLRYIVSMVVSCIVLWLLLMIIEYRLIQKIFTFKKKPPPIDDSTQDEDVAAEATGAREMSPFKRANQALLATELSKYYGKHLAVNQVSFRVSDGECFGLLGVNGAGKTTTFKMLMGDESISSGEAYVSGHSVRTSLNKVHQNIGYCPQFDALFPELSGRETLRVFALMRGLRASAAARTAGALALALGFHQHLDKRVHQYSGGTKRKLSTAVAFLGRTRLVFVDEPTTGVDPAAKRHVWCAMRGVQRAGRGVVLTSHSMEECEALCSRLTIMVNGQFQCIGTPQHLKNKFSEGFTLIIKLKNDENDVQQRSLMRQTSIVSVTACAIKNYVNENFANPRIMEEYQGLLTFYLPDRSMPWSRMFGIMEHAKQSLEVEDYTISQTTLEQIFLQFTKYQGHVDFQNTEAVIASLPTDEVASEVDTNSV